MTQYYALLLRLAFSSRTRTHLTLGQTERAMERLTSAMESLLQTFHCTLGIRGDPHARVSSQVI